jgi:hypothetical protein
MSSSPVVLTPEHALAAPAGLDKTQMDRASVAQRYSLPSL